MNYQEALEKLEQYFCDLLIIQYKTAPENQAMVKMLVDIVFANMLILQVKDGCVDLDNSVGVQLDVVGKWLMLDRFFQGENEFGRPYFSMPSYAQVKSGFYSQYMGGFSTYENFNTELGGWLMYQDDINVKTTFNKLNDDLYRPLLKLKAIKNSITYTNKNIDEAIWNWSNGNVYTAWENPMEVTYNYNAEYAYVMELAQQKDVLLAPSGVNIILKEVA